MLYPDPETIQHSVISIKVAETDIDKHYFWSSSHKVRYAHDYSGKKKRRLLYTGFKYRVYIQILTYYIQYIKDSMYIQDIIIKYSYPIFIIFRDITSI